jgi:hypothetical protein
MSSCTHICSSDHNLLDQVFPLPTISADILIPIDQIKKAAQLLKDSTSFLSDFKPLSTSIPLVKTTVNKIIAGQNRTLADLFDLTGWASTLTGTPTSVSPFLPELTYCYELLHLLYLSYPLI